MAVQILVLVLAFYLGYRYALTKAAPKPDAQQPAAPETTNRKPKKGKAKKQQKQTQQQKQTESQPSKPKQPSEKQIDQNPIEKQIDQNPIEKQPLLAPIDETKEPASSSSSSSPPTHTPASPNAWETVRNSGSAQAPQRASAAIPVHQTRWANLDIDENLDHSLNAKAAQPRVLRIGAPAGPPPKALPRIRYDPPEPQKLTKKQRQTQRQMQKRREEHAQAAAIQEQRLREHRRQLEDTRAREQWEKAKRAKARKAQQQGGAPKGSGPSCIDGKLVWD
ncbi:hypothetical protein GGI23_003034 [Coemansia sp. RSA 2559]|nr:hypothetical protein GGI23_003034 [Coemansia sp. RSA 2559]